MPTVSKLYDIKSLIEDKAKIRVVSSSEVRIPGGGGTITEYHSNCPWCPGSHDSFITCPETGWASHAIRSGCGWTGDAIDFLEDYCEMERSAAIKYLELEHVSFYDPKPDPKRTRLDPPSVKWQETAKNFVERAALYLWSSSHEAQEALAYLRGRGLEDTTIRRKKLGYCPLQNDGRWYGIDPLQGGLEHWGLKPEDVSERIAERGTILIPPGVIIPWYEQDTLWKIAVRRLDEPDPDRRYRPVAGSGEGALYNLDSIKPGKPIMLVEAEFCATAVEQAVPDLVSVVATGSDMKGRNPRFASRFEAAPFLIQGFDNDEPGRNGARYWFLRYDRCFRHAPAGRKDPNDMLRDYGKAFVQEWVQGALDLWEGYQQAGIVPTLARGCSDTTSLPS